MSGKLIIVPTPVGNLADITYRAVDTLRTADMILAEDTRQTSVLLKHYGISTPMQAFHKFNEHRSVEYFVNQINAGKKIALVSDSGTPGISDPGFLIVRECVKAAIDVECLPGATAFVPALVVSGLPCEKFCFEGFLPQKKGRQKRLQQLVNEPRTIIFYESPYRVVKALEEFVQTFGAERLASVSREISKLHEQTLRGTLQVLLQHFKNTTPKGEFVITVAGSAYQLHQSESSDTGYSPDDLNE